MDKLEKEMISHKEAVNTIKFTADGNFCMTASSDRTVKLWNPHRSDVIHKNLGFLIKTYSGIHGYGINDVTISSDNFKYVSAGGDK
jgi:mitogen-activated protein kinase organizer 1